MVTTTSYGTWVNHGDDSNATVEASIADAINGGDKDWRERMESSGAMDDIARDWREAINEALPEGVTLAGNDFYGPAYDADASWEGELKIADVIKGIDLGAIIERHDIDIPAEGRPQPVIVSVVRGESPTARAVEPGPIVTIPDEWTTWAEGHGLGPDDTEVYLLVTPEDEAGEVAGEIAYRKFWIPAEDVAAIRAALDPAGDAGDRAEATPTPEPEPVGPFDVRVFSSEPEFAPRQGVVCIIVAQSWAEAWKIHDRESARPRRSAGIFYADTNQRVTANRPAAPSA